MMELIRRGTKKGPPVKAREGGRGLLMAEHRPPSGGVENPGLQFQFQASTAGPVSSSWDVYTASCDQGETMMDERFHLGNDSRLFSSLKGF